MNSSRNDRGRTSIQEISTCGNCHAISRVKCGENGFHTPPLMSLFRAHQPAGRSAISVQGDITVAGVARKTGRGGLGLRVIARHEPR